jgi:hypothetical protein
MISNSPQHARHTRVEEVVVRAEDNVGRVHQRPAPEVRARWAGQGEEYQRSAISHHAGQGRAGQGRAGQGRAGQGRAGQGRAGQGEEYQPSAISQQPSAGALGSAPPRPTRHTLGGLGYADQVLDVPCRMLAALHRQRPRATLLLPCDTLSLAYRLHGMAWPGIPASGRCGT